MILAGCSIEEALNYNGKMSVDDEKVYLNIKTSKDDIKKAFTVALENRQVKAITVEGVRGGDVDSLPEVPEKLVGMVFICEDIADIKEKNGYEVLVQLENSYCDMLSLYKLSRMHPSVHYIGGKLLEIPGIHIGRFDKGKEKLSSYFDGIYDYFVEAELSELSNIDLIRSRVGKHNKKDYEMTDDEDKKEKKSSKKSSVKKPKYSVSSLFESDAVDF